MSIPFTIEEIADATKGLKNEKITGVKKQTNKICNKRNT